MGEGEIRPARDYSLQETLIGEVALYGVRGSPNRLDRRSSASEVRTIGEHKIGAEFRQANGGSPPDPAGGSRD